MIDRKATSTPWTGHDHNGLTDRQVGKAMDPHVNRIESMMFTGTLIPDEPRVPRRVRHPARS